MMEYLFWCSLAAIIYAYFGYPLVLMLLSRLRPLNITDETAEYQPLISVIIPAHNEEAVIAKKIENTLSLQYPEDRVEILIVSDGSTDKTDEIIEKFTDDPRIKFYKVDKRQGKANALNTALLKVSHDIVVFSDSSIILSPNALINIVAKFQDERIGCISGEDHISESGGEGLYGKYELYLRNQESKIGSIVGASGSFYAQRRHLCQPFVEGVAPDLLSVLNTVEQGYRAISEPKAYGEMTSVKSHRDEFKRKVRTLVRGMAGLFSKKALLNPAKYGLFSFVLISHKLFRWSVPFFLIMVLISNTYLLYTFEYFVLFILQLIFYAAALLAYLEYNKISKSLFGKIPLYFTGVNIAILVAWYRYMLGFRQEIWEPSKRK